MILRADARHIPLADCVVQTVVTSPPYWGLRDYGTARWQDGDEGCDHMAPPRGGMGPASAIQVQVKRLDYTSTGGQYPHNCRKCGARRIDAQIGLEPTPEAYIETMVGVMREVWRVLKDDGTVWLNLGDSYAGSGKGGQSDEKRSENWQPSYPHIRPGSARADGIVDGRVIRNRDGIGPVVGFKPKDLIGMPWRLVFALHADGWYLRSDIVWAKPNPIPESVTDRPTRSHEYIFLLTKSSRYYYDAEAIREDFAESSIERLSQPTFLSQHGGSKDYGEGSNRSARRALENLHAKMPQSYHGSLFTTGKSSNHGGLGAPIGQGPRYEHSGRNKRDVWTVNSEPTPKAHFATFPQKLIEPCILAGTSEKGECVRCGKNWVRVTESTASGRRDDGRGDQRTTTGWRPQCDCDASTRPNIVLDPFIGSGTVGKVCERFGRRWVGLELSAPYIEIARRRSAQIGLRF